MKYNLARLATISGLAALLGSCATYHSMASYIGSDKTSLCPDAAILAPTSSLPAFAPKNGGDPSAVSYTVAMTNVVTRCTYDKEEKTADARVRINFHAARPPGGSEAHYRVPYFLAVSRGGDIVAKTVYWADVEFAPGATQTDGEVIVDSTTVTVTGDNHIYDYHLLTGFQLTKAQLDYNSKIGRYEP
ncbi:MAG: hypothetical protein WCA81_14480 [Rhizomicrobium sp.]|jgi:hypothetical protein